MPKIGIDTVLGTASQILNPFIDLLMTPEILGIISLIYVLTKFENWLNRKAVLGPYEQELILEKEKIDLRKKIMSKKWKPDIDFDKLLNDIASEKVDEINKYFSEWREHK